MNSKKLRINIIVIIFIIGILVGCSKEKISDDKEKNIDFTVMEAGDVPEELDKIIKDKRKEAFKLSYTDKEYTYIAVGYGEQSTGGYSITVDELYLTKNAVCIDTTLKGPGKDELVLKAKSYPYIVVKMEYIDKNIVFNP